MEPVYLDLNTTKGLITNFIDRQKGPLDDVAVSVCAKRALSRLKRFKNADFHTHINTNQPEIEFSGDGYLWDKFDFLENKPFYVNENNKTKSYFRITSEIAFKCPVSEEPSGIIETISYWILRLDVQLSEDRQDKEQKISLDYYQIDGIKKYKANLTRIKRS